jgi:hypothetical protein
MRSELIQGICGHRMIFCKIAWPAWTRGAKVSRCGRVQFSFWERSHCLHAEESRHGRHRQLHRLEVFDRHEYAKKLRERYVLMRTNSALPGGRRADVTGLGVRTGTKFPTNKYVR